MYARTAPEWELVGGDPAPGDPCAYDRLAGFFGETAANAGEVSCWLRRLVSGTDDSIWRGAAADAFRADITEVPKKLDKLHDSYHEASEALRYYGVRLRELQGEADTELGKAVCADEEHAAAIRAMTDPHGIRGPLDPDMIGSAPTMTGPGPSCADPAEGPQVRLAAARAAVERIRQNRETAEAQAIAKLDHASDMGIQNKGLLDRISGWVGDRIDDARDLHHKMLRAIGDLADRLADVLTVVAVALLVVALVAGAAAFVVGTAGGGGLLALSLAGTFTSAAGAAGTVLGWAGIATAVSVGAKVESKLLYHDRDLAWRQLAKDGAFAALGVAGGPVKVSKFVRNSRYFQAAAWRMGELAASGNRVAEFSIKAAQFAGQGASKYQTVRDAVLGTEKTPTLAGTLYSGWKETKGLWDKHKDDPLAILRDPIQTAPGEWERPDGAFIWARDAWRAIAQV
jgi:uncharacterized protein YukE